MLGIYFRYRYIKSTSREYARRFMASNGNLNEILIMNFLIFFFMYPCHVCKSCDFIENEEEKQYINCLTKKKENE